MLPLKVKRKRWGYCCHCRAVTRTRFTQSNTYVCLNCLSIAKHDREQLIAVMYNESDDWNYFQSVLKLHYSWFVDWEGVGGRGRTYGGD